MAASGDDGGAMRSKLNGLVEARNDSVPIDNGERTKQDENASAVW